LWFGALCVVRYNRFSVFKSAHGLEMPLKMTHVPY
jgi:hypothetical protein